jgi:RHS repeat-associated protein
VFVYDFLRRRIRRQVWTWNAGVWLETTVTRSVYHGRRVVLELAGSTGLPPAAYITKKYTWGLDLAGLVASGAPAGRLDAGYGAPALQGAGGIGGLLAVHDLRTGDPQDDLYLVYTYDGNGNVGQLIDWSHDPGDPAGAIVAKYEYDPYGNVIAQSGSYGDENPFRFSTKQFDAETGLIYFGGRYYSPGLGRFLNRDPIGELGGANLYAFVGNDPVNWEEKRERGHY